jgi:hypothetical protein
MEAKLKKLLFFICVLVMFATLLSTQRWVVGEVMTISWCGTCPPARSALNTFAVNEATYPYFIPVLWQGDINPSPNIAARQTLYGMTGWPWIQFGGHIQLWPFNVTVGANTYNTLANTPSPLTLDVAESINGNQLTATANFSILDDIATTNNRIVFLLTYNWGNHQTPQTGNYNYSVVAYNDQTFTHTSAGQSGSMNHTFTLNPSWAIEGLTVIALVQTFAGNRTIHQAAKIRAGLVDPPDNVTLDLPLDGATNTSRTPTFTWAAPDSETDEIQYAIQISTLSDFSTLVVNATVDHPITTFTVPNNLRLTNSTEYHWRVIARTAGGNAQTPHPSRSFITHPKPNPPTNLAIATSGSSVTLNWVEPTTGPFDGFRVYREETLLTPEFITDLTFTDTGLSAGFVIYLVMSYYIETESDPVVQHIIVDPTSDLDESLVYKSTSLLGNYPNPFNPTTSIQFTIGETTLQSDGALVQIDIYNIRGQLVRSLVNRNFESGTHSVIWNGLDDDGLPVGSGVYLYQLRTDDYVLTRKMIMMK